MIPIVADQVLTMVPSAPGTHVVLRKLARRHSGLWVGFVLEATAAAALAVPDGEPAEDLHVTVAYVPDVPTLPREVVTALRRVTTQFAPLDGAIAGAGRFPATEASEGRDVLIAHVTAERLDALRAWVLEALAGQGLPVPPLRGYVPHVTLRYVQAESPESIEDVPALPLRFRALVVRAGDDEATIPLTGRLEKDKDDPADLVDNLLRDLRLEGFAVLTDPTQELLERLAMEGARTGGAALKAMVPDAANFALPADQVREWAREHAAELVGMRRLEDGTVIQNPNPVYAISENTREMLRGTLADAFRDGVTREKLIEGLQASYAFSKERATVIARTEVSAAYVAGNKLAWAASGLVVGKQSILSDLHDVDDLCNTNAAAGPIPLEQPYPSGSISVPHHPRCECDEIPILQGEL